jgi:hypothetical protein
MNPFNESDEKYGIYKKVIFAKLTSIKTFDGLTLGTQLINAQNQLQNQQYDEKKY